MSVAVINLGDEPLPSNQPVILSDLPVTLTVTDDQVIITATGLDPDGFYLVESSLNLASFPDRDQVTGAQLMAGYTMAKSDPARYYRISPTNE